MYKIVTAAGTFDRLHAGHKFFLRHAFEVGEKVMIGLTSDEFVKNKVVSGAILSYEQRESDLIAFLGKANLLSRATIFKLDDIYGPALDKESLIEAILVTDATIDNARLINEKRQSLNLAPLILIRVELIESGLGTPLSSTSLRLFDNNLSLPEDLRPILAKPLGILLEGKEEDLGKAVDLAKKLITKDKPNLIITVGDVVTHSFNEGKILPDLAIVDFRVKREETIKSLRELGFTKEEPDYIVKSPAGTIASSLSKIIEKTIEQFNKNNNQPFVIKVLGEEDLAVLPAIILSPTNTAIFYGQPDEGIVYIKVDEEAKTRTLELLAKFKILLL